MDTVTAGTDVQAAHTESDDFPGETPSAGGTRWWEWCLYVLAVLVGVVLVIGPSNLAWDRAFVAWVAPGYDQAVIPGDHLQLTYELWLWGDALTSLSHFPWTDAYLYAASGVVSSQNFGWPLVFMALPVDLVFGPVAAYNVLVYVVFVLSAACTAAWVRALGVSKWGAAVAGFAFAFAPFRVVQGVGHANALLAWMFPLLLLCLEKAIRGDERTARRWAWAAATVQLSIAASGELHLLVFSGLLLGGYVLLRAPGVGMARLRMLALPAAVTIGGTVAIVGLIYAFLIAPSSEGEGRTVEEAAHFAPRIGDLLRRDVTWRHYERYVYPGAAIVVGAVVGGVVALARRRTRWLAIGLGFGVAAALFLALTPGLVGHPGLQSVYRAVPGLSFSRVPGRIWILGALFLAALVGFAVDALARWRWAQAGVAVVVVAVLLVDVPRGIYRDLPAVAEPYRDVPRGATILELPPFEPGHSSGSPYSFYVTQNPGPRLGGYYVLAKPEADLARQRTVPLVDSPDDECLWEEIVDDYDVEYVAVHRDLFGDEGLTWPADSEAIIGALEASDAFAEVSDHDGVAVFAVDADDLVCADTQGT